MLNKTSFNEKQLLELITKDNECAFAGLFKHYKDKIFGIAYKLTKSHVIAEEIVQDVFLKIWLKRTELKSIQNFGAYLFIVTRNESYKVLHEIARNYKLNTITEEDLLLAPHDLVVEKEYDSLLQNAIKRLPAQQKQVYYLVKDEGLKREEVARQLHIGPETVKFHLAQAMKTIRAFCLLHLEVFISSLILLPLLRNN
ncbi:MAG: sigma-70 family RNA polymerase sigma factor [Ginsengibacter sp.]